MTAKPVTRPPSQTLRSAQPDLSLNRKIASRCAKQIPGVDRKLQNTSGPQLPCVRNLLGEIDPLWQKVLNQHLLTGKGFAVRISQN